MSTEIENGMPRAERRSCMNLCRKLKAKKILT